MTFYNLGLREELLKAVEAMGFQEATPIQESTITAFFESDDDIIGLAQTGTGKTGAFGLPVLNTLVHSDSTIQALILCPTRELCLQSAEALKEMAMYRPELTITPIYGGAPIDKQLRELRKGTDIVVATPGRLLDVIRRRAADIRNVRYLILDEADIMLNMGFKEELDAIMEALPDERRSLLFSATMPAEVERIAEEYMHSPKEITIGAKNSAVSTVEHKYYSVPSRDKYQALKRLIDFNPQLYGIVFCRTRQNARDISSKLNQDGYNAEPLHGDLSQAQRESAMEKFRSRTVQLLIATDVAARGIDIDDLTHIIHYDIPDEKETYNHRSGRTGRAGKTGISLALISRKDKFRIHKFGKMMKTDIAEERVPNGKAICRKQLFHQIDRLTEASVNEEQLAPLLSEVEKRLAHLDREEIIKRFVALEMNGFISEYDKQKDILPEKEHSSSGRKQDRSSWSHGKNTYGSGKSKKSGSRNDKKVRYTSVSVNIGKKDKVLPLQLIGMINETTRSGDIRIGKIDIGKVSSSVEVDSRFADHVSAALKGYSFKGRKVKATAVS